MPFPLLFSLNFVWSLLHDFWTVPEASVAHDRLLVSSLKERDTFPHFALPTHKQQTSNTSHNMSGPSWLGLLKWSLQQQDVEPSEGLHEMPEEDRR